MSLYMGLNRRSGGDRRLHDVGALPDQRGLDRRRHGTDKYMLVVGDSGIDRFGLAVGFPVALLIAGVIVAAFVRT